MTEKIWVINEITGQKALVPASRLNHPVLGKYIREVNNEKPIFNFRRRFSEPAVDSVTIDTVPIEVIDIEEED